MQTNFIPKDSDIYMAHKDQAESALNTLRNSVDAFYHPNESTTLHNIEQIADGGHTTLDHLEEAARHAHNYISELEKHYPQFNSAGGAVRGLREGFREAVPSILKHLFRA